MQSIKILVHFVQRAKITIGPNHLDNSISRILLFLDKLNFCIAIVCCFGYTYIFEAPMITVPNKYRKKLFRKMF